VSAPGPGHVSPARGDEADLYRELQPRLVGLLRATLVVGAQTLEDACSFAWVQLISHQPQRGPDLLGWLYVVARREALHQTRLERRTPILERAGDRHLLAFRDPAQDATRERAREALEALAALPERQRRLLAMKAAGYSYDEIATLEQISWRTVDRQLRRARARARLAGEEGEGGEP